MTDRALAVLYSAAEGESILEAAEEIGCSPAWIAKIRSDICKELGARNMNNAISIAYQRGLLSTRACDLCAFRER